MDRLMEDGEVVLWTCATHKDGRIDALITLHRLGCEPLRIKVGEARTVAAAHEIANKLLSALKEVPKEWLAQCQAIPDWAR